MFSLAFEGVLAPRALGVLDPSPKGHLTFALGVTRPLS